MEYFIMCKDNIFSKLLRFYFLDFDKVYGGFARTTKCHPLKEKYGKF